MIMGTLYADVEDFHGSSPNSLNLSMQPLIYSHTILGFLFWFLYIVWAICEVSNSKKRRTSGTSEGDKNSGVILMILIVIAILACFLVALNVLSTTINVHRHAIYIVGLIIMALGIGLRQYSVKTLGDYFTFTVTVAGDQPVIDIGPYKYVRHPSYTGAIMILAGIGLAMTNWLSLACILIPTLIGYVNRANVEEKALAQSIGVPYIDYMKRTKRFVPFVV